MPSRLRIKDDRTISLDDRSSSRFVGGPGPVVLIGDLSLIDFSDLLNLIVNARMSGVLRVTAPSGDRTLTFEEGELRGTTSTRVGERLSEVIVRMSYVKPDVMDRLVRESLGQRMGRAVVERGLLSERDLWNAIQEQVISIFQSIMLESSAVFTFSEGSVDASVTVPGLSVEMLLIEGLRRIDEQEEASPSDLRIRRELIVAEYNEVFRDVFTTARSAGRGEEIERAARSAFAGDAVQSAIFEGIGFDEDGEIPAEAFLDRFDEAARLVADPPEEFLRSVLASAMLFLLFVCGEHLEPDVHQALHGRAKAAVGLRV